jgi:signal transduction histidine kinase
VGIPADALPKIFDRFYQVDDASTRAVGGTGIGLALAREIVELHGGKISAESVEGEGTTLRFWLPLSPPKTAVVERRRTRVDGGRERRRVEESGLPEWHEALKGERSYRMLPLDDATERRVAPRSRSQGRAPMVLVVEDNRDMIQFLVTLLAPGFNTMTALDGAQGLRLAAAKQPDVIVSDVMMPEMDGFEMLRQLRADPKTSGIPVILLTAKGEAEDRIEGRSGGADAYLHKPFRADELLAAVSSLAQRQESVQESARRDRDEALVFLAGGVTDVLTTASNQFSHALATLDPDSAVVGEQAQALMAARTGLTELMALTHELRHFALAGVGDVAVEVSVNEAVGRAVAIAEDAAAERVVMADLRAKRAVKFPLGQLDRVVLHLLLNAIDATVAPGNIHVSTEDGLEGEVIIRVQDSGPGVPAEYSEHVFFPYYSTDPEAKPGMGLAVSRRIVELHGGKLQVERDGKSGSAFVLRLPSLSPRSFPSKRLG